MRSSHRRFGPVVDVAVVVAAALSLCSCAGLLSYAEPELCRQAHKSCNPTEPGYAECIRYPECGIE